MLGVIAPPTIPDFISDLLEMWIETRQQLPANPLDMNFISDLLEMWIETSKCMAKCRPI